MIFSVDHAGASWGCFRMIDRVSVHENGKMLSRSELRKRLAHRIDHVEKEIDRACECDEPWPLSKTGPCQVCSVQSVLYRQIDNRHQLLLCMECTHSCSVFLKGKRGKKSKGRYELLIAGWLSAILEEKAKFPDKWMKERNAANKERMKERNIRKRWEWDNLPDYLKNRALVLLDNS